MSLAIYVVVISAAAHHALLLRSWRLMIGPGNRAVTSGWPYRRWPNGTPRLLKIGSSKYAWRRWHRGVGVAPHSHFFCLCHRWIGNAATHPCFLMTMIGANRNPIVGDSTNGNHIARELASGVNCHRYANGSGYTSAAGSS